LLLESTALPTCSGFCTLDGPAGITPMRVMFLDALKRGVHAVLVYSMRTEAEVHIDTAHSRAKKSRLAAQQHTFWSALHGEKNTRLC
jgi:ferredoxin-NADP reductase